MPLITTFGGGSVRSFGRGLGQAIPMVPANAVIPYNVPDISNATIPTGWSQFSKFDNKFIIGTSTNSEIGTSLVATGNVNVSMTTTSNGAHGAGANTNMVSSFTSVTGNSFTTWAVSDHTGHTHDSSNGYINVSGAMPNTISTPYIKSSVIQEVLPPKAIVFRREVPTAMNFNSFTPPGNGYFYGGQTSTWTDRTGAGVGYGTSPTGGLHRHDVGKYQLLFASGASTPFHGDAGTHTHPFIAALNATLKSKHLEAWVSDYEQLVEPGMIVMYDGNLSALPSGWRVCNGLGGTPDMVDYFVGYRSGLSHDQVIESSTAATVASVQSLQQVNWTHTHAVSSGQYAARAGGMYHGNLSVPHAHDVNSYTVGSVITQYMPNCTKIAFIQYKQI